MRRALIPLAVLLVASLGAPGQAAPQQTLSRPGQVVTWTGTLTTPDPMGCGEVASKGCDITPLRVVAAKGTWITISFDDELGFVRVTDGSTYVASSGYNQGLSSTSNLKTQTTFRQVRSGAVTYQVGFSDGQATPVSPVTYRIKATFAGKAFDREGECFVGDSGVAALQATDDGAVLPLSVRLVAEPNDAAEVRQKVAPALIETYARINIKVRVSFDIRTLRDIDTYPFEQVRRAYGGVRPAGVDAVHVVTDNFSGGFAECLGGVAYPEFGFSNGSLHYATEGVVPNPLVASAAIAAHEIGHVLGGQHQMTNCAEAAPQQVQDPASDGNVGACTVMNPAAGLISETFSTWEKAVIRSYTRRYAHG